MTTQPGVSAAESRRAHMEDLLARYPSLKKDQQEELVRWFRREASALDVGIIASNEAIEAGYRRFRADHLDRYRLSDLVYGSAFVTLLAALIAVIAVWGS